MWYHLSSFTQWELQPSCFHILPFFCTNSDSWMNIGQGELSFNIKATAFPMSVLQKNMQVWSFNENTGLINKPHNTTQTGAAHLTNC